MGQPLLSLLCTMIFSSVVQFWDSLLIMPCTKAVFESPQCKCWVEEKKKTNLLLALRNYIHASLSKWNMKLRVELHGVTDKEWKGHLEWLKSQDLGREIGCTQSTLCLPLLMSKMASLSQPHSKSTQHAIQKQRFTREWRGDRRSVAKLCANTCQSPFRFAQVFLGASLSCRPVSDIFHTPVCF